MLKEDNIVKTNWTELADKWITAKERIEDRFVTLLPSLGQVRELPPTPQTIINSMNTEQLAKVSFFLIVNN